MFHINEYTGSSGPVVRPSQQESGSLHPPGEGRQQIHSGPPTQDAIIDHYRNMLHTVLCTGTDRCNSKNAIMNVMDTRWMEIWIGGSFTGCEVLI